MNRSIIDKLISSMGALLAIALLAAAGGLFYTYNFVHGEVKAQLEPQNIVFPAADSASFTSLPEADREAVKPFAGQQVVTGKGAEVFANHYIAVHIEQIGGGKSYSQLSEESRANPDDAAAAAKVDTVFRGETLRGMLLNAYAFDTMAIVARYAAFGALFAGVVLAGLSLLGFRHAKVTEKKATKKSKSKR